MVSFSLHPFYDLLALDIHHVCATSFSRQDTTLLQKYEQDREKNVRDMLRGAQWPVPCGYYKQLCCAANEICYTAPNNEASCSPTAFPSTLVTQTVTANPRTITEQGKTVTANPRTMTSVSIKTKSVVHDKTVKSVSKYTITSVLIKTKFIIHDNTVKSVSKYTLTTTRTATHELPGATTTTATSLVAGAGSQQDGNDSCSGDDNATTCIQTKHEKGMPTWEKGVIAGVIIGATALVVVAIFFWLKRRNKNQRLQVEQEAQTRATQEDPDAIPPMQTARIHRQPSQQVQSPASVLSLVPREQPQLVGANPYDQPPPRSNGTPYDPNDVVAAPPYLERRSVTPRMRRGEGAGFPPDYAGGRGAGDQQQYADGTGYAPVPQPPRAPRGMGRRPVNCLRPTVEDDWEY